MSQRDGNLRVVAKSSAAMKADDFVRPARFLHVDYVLDWPRSGQRIRGRDNFVAVNGIIQPPHLGASLAPHDRG